MKKILILFLMFTSLFSSTPLQMERNTREEVIKDIMKAAILEPGFIPQETQITENANDLIQPFNIATQCESYTDLACPPAQKGYFVRRTASDLKRGKVNCLVYSEDNIDRAIKNFTYTNPTCKERWAPDASSTNASSFLQAIAQKSDQELKILQQAQTEAKTRTQGLNDTHLNLSDILMAVMTMDGEKINLVQSIGQGKIKINDGYTAITENTKGMKLSDLATDAINTKVVAIFEFMSKSASTIGMAVIILLLCFALAFAIKSGVLFRPFFQSERENKKADALMWGLGLIGAVMFFLVPNVDISINAEQRIQQSKFHQTLQYFFSEASKFSNIINIAVHDATFSALLKERGYKSKEQIYQAAAENVKLEGLTQKAQAEYARCNQLFDTAEMKKYMGTFGQFVFPLSEEELHKKVLLSAGSGIASSPYLDFVNDAKKSGGSVLTTGITFSQCGQAERAYHEGKLKIAQNHEYLTTANSKIDQVRRAKVMDVVNRQYKAISDYGFISAAFLPAALVELELLDRYAKHGEGGEKITENDQKDFIDKMFYNIPYLIFPGTGTIISTSVQMSESVVGGIPFIGQFFKGLAAVGGAMLAVEVVKIVLLIAPLLIMTIVALVLGIILFFQVIAYFISGFFAVLLAVWHQNGDNIFRFLGRGVRLFAKIVAFPLAIFFALEAHWIAISVGGYLSSAFADNNTSGFWSSMGYQIFGGFLEIIIVIVSIFLTFKIVTTFVDMILENLNFKQQDMLEQSVEQIQQQVARAVPQKVL